MKKEGPLAMAICTSLKTRVHKRIPVVGEMTSAS